MKKIYKSLCTCLLFFTAFVCNAQDSFQPGFAVLNDGTRVSGEIMLYSKTPWSNQRYIWMKDSVAVAANPNAKPKKYKADDLKSYQVGNRSFEKVHFVDLEKLQFKNLGTNDHMMERLNTGKITAYRYYGYPIEFVRVAASEDEMEKKLQKENDDLLNSWKYLARKGDDDKYRDIFDYDLQKYFEDTPEVLQKYQAGGYGNEPVSQKKGLAAKMMAMAKKATYAHMQYEPLVAAINDYNAKNPVK